MATRTEYRFNQRITSSTEAMKVGNLYALYLLFIYDIFLLLKQ